VRPEPDSTALSDESRQPRRLLGWCLWIPAIGIAGFLWLALICVCIYGFSAARFSGPRIASPDGTYEVQVTSDNCGATCAYHTNIALRERRTRWYERLFNSGDGTTIHSSKNGPCGINPAWTNVRTLEIGVYSSSSEVVYAQKSVWRDVTINYGPLTREQKAHLSRMKCEDRWSFPGVSIWVPVGLSALIAITLGAAGLIHLISRRRMRLQS
jgi:hypothetical protein